MARKKIREYDSKRLLREHLKRLAGIDLQILSAQVSALFSLPDSLSPSACVAGRRISGGSRPAERIATLPKGDECSDALVKSCG
jgi:hypothetical protein